MRKSDEKTLFHRGIFYWIPSFVCAYFWVVAMSLLEHALSGWGLTVWTTGVFVVLPALLQSPARGLVNVVFAGLLADAALPVDFVPAGTPDVYEDAAVPEIFGAVPEDVSGTFGFVTGWLVAAFIVLRFFRRVVPVTSFKCWLVSAEIVNTVVFLIWAFAFGRENIGSGAYWTGTFLTLIASSSALIVFGWFYFDALVGAYRLCGVDLIAQREVLDDE